MKKTTLRHVGQSMAEGSFNYSAAKLPLHYNSRTAMSRVFLF